MNKLSNEKNLLHLCGVDNLSKNKVFAEIITLKVGDDLTQIFPKEPGRVIRCVIRSSTSGIKGTPFSKDGSEDSLAGYIDITNLNEITAVQVYTSFNNAGRTASDVSPGIGSVFKRTIHITNSIGEEFLD